MSSLRQFRFQRSVPGSSASSGELGDDGAAGGQKRARTPEEEEPGPGVNGVQQHNSGSAYDAETDDGDSQQLSESPVFRPSQSKRPRILSDSSPTTNGNSQDSLNLPESSIIEAKLDALQKAFPQKDRMELQDVLRSSKWLVKTALEQLQPSTNARQPGFQAPKKAAIKRNQLSLLDNSREANGAQADSSGDSDSEGEYNMHNVVYDSEDSDGEKDYEMVDAHLSDDKKRVLNFFNSATDRELSCIQGCSKKKVEAIVELRPYDGWGDLVRKIQLSRMLHPEMLNNTTLLIKMRDAIAKLMERCEKITKKMESMVEDLTKGDKTHLELTEQPKSLNGEMKLTGFQLIGLNWLVLMHKQSVNGILADEMGLGKTIQSISFIAHLKDMGDEGPHLIIVPSSTMENWQKEISLWCPSLKVLNYYGSQDERRHMRLQIVNEEVEFDLILTTYNMVISSADDRVLFRKLEFHYVIFDEAHMLKNMATARYENLMRVKSSRKLLLTGTPMQNNLVELMSLLVFVMPDMFENKKEQLKKMFSMFPKSQEDTSRSRYEKDRIAHAKRIMKPFFLRRLKSEVLTELPKKTEIVVKVPMSSKQLDLYRRLVSEYKERAKAIAAGDPRDPSESGVGLLMNLRKAANHPLLIRSIYDNEKIRVLAKLLKKQDPGHREANVNFIVEDLSVMSDYQIHKTCELYRCIEHHSLGNHEICNSGKFRRLDELLPGLSDAGDRVLIFSQFTMVMDIMESYLRIRGYKYLRLDGSTPVQERQVLIDQFNQDDSIFIFILSTRAGGLGINLTAANTVILHDIDFNPYNDKQAEDRCHRVGQERSVRVYRLISEDTIEKGIYTCAQDKLQLEKDLSDHSSGSDVSTSNKTKRDLKKLLKIALDVEMSEKALGDVEKVYTEL